MEIMIIVVAVHRVVGVQSVAVRIEKRRTEERRALRNAHELSFPRDDGEREERKKKPRAVSRRIRIRRDSETLWKPGGTAMTIDNRDPRDKSARTRRRRRSDENRGRSPSVGVVETRSLPVNVNRKMVAAQRDDANRKQSSRFPETRGTFTQNSRPRRFARAFREDTIL